MAELVLENLAKTYSNGVLALRDVQLEVHDGEFMVLVGPSGSGKTTLLRLIAGLETPTSGGITIDGCTVPHLAPRERGVGLMFQRHSLYPHLTVRDNLAFPLRLQYHNGWPFRWLRPAREREIERRVLETVRLLDLENVLGRLPQELSGGQQQRVALGRVLIRQPRVVLLDEPLSHLDAGLRGELRQQLHLLHRRLQATIIYVTHDQFEALSLAHRVAVLKDGTLQQVGTPVEVYENPRNRFVAGFIGWPPMNFLEGRLKDVNGLRCLQSGEVALPLPRESPGTAGAALVLGIRPEHVNLRVPCLPGLPMTVDFIEPLGQETLVGCRRADWQLVVRVRDKADCALGQTVEVGFEMERIHWFDAATGLALHVAGPAG